MSSTDTNYRAASFAETYTGRRFYPLNPRVGDVSIIDIGHHLAYQCRYAGATEWFYPTAQHCCLLCDYVRVKRRGSPLDQLQILMHDSAEAYLTDIVRPVKQFMPQFRGWDHTITMLIREWLGLGGTPIPEWQDELDSRIIVDERAQVMSDSGIDWELGEIEPLGVIIEPWSPPMAEQQFLGRYASLTREVFGAPYYLRSGWGVPLDSTFVAAAADFQTRDSDVRMTGDAEPQRITDLMEVDLRGGVGRVRLRSPDGMMIRDTRAGKFPKPAWKWIHGTFVLDTAPEITDASPEIAA